MQNVNIIRTGTKLTITIDLAERGTPSASGKTTVLASTNGNVDVPGCDGVKLGINLYAYPQFNINKDRVVGSFPSRRNRR